MPAPEPVESTLRLVSARDPQRVAITEEAAGRSPAETVDLLRSRLKPTAPPQAPPAPVAEEPDSATELRMWASEVPAKKKRLSPVWILLAGALVAVAVLAVVFRSVWLPGHSAQALVTNLQLAVESEDNGLISLRWNPRSVPVTEAREGRLTITEDQQAPRVVSLTAVQLTAGHLFYESSAARVDFQLEIVGKSGAVTRESALAAKKPAPTNAQPPVETAQATQVTAQAPPPVAATPQEAKPAPKTFTPPPVPTQRDHPGEGRVILMEPAPSIAGAPAVPTATILPERATVAPPPQETAMPKPPAQQRIQVGGKLQSAMLLRKVEPAYPQLARQMRVQGLVRFQAVISKEGEVKNLTFVSGPRMLQQAAADAVKHWVYRPTLLDGRPVEVSTQIDLNFTLHD